MRSERTTQKSFVAIGLLASEEAERAKDPRRRSFVARLRASNASAEMTQQEGVPAVEGEAPPAPQSAERRPQFAVAEDPDFYKAGRGQSRRKAVMVAIAIVVAVAAPFAVRAGRFIVRSSGAAIAAPASAPAASAAPTPAPAALPTTAAVVAAPTASTSLTSVAP